MSHGFSNHESWLVYTWTTGDVVTRDMAYAVVKNAKLDTGEAADNLKYFVNELLIVPHQQESGLSADLLTGAVEAVNWHEVARHLHEEANDDN